MMRLGKMMRLLFLSAQSFSTNSKLTGKPSQRNVVSLANMTNGLEAAHSTGTLVLQAPSTESCISGQAHKLSVLQRNFILN
jgi:hypothetical protein